MTTTLKDTLIDVDQPPSEANRVPGLVLVFSNGRAYCAVLAMKGDRLLIGRELLPSSVPPDPRMSRKHVEVTWDRERGFRVCDPGSSNGTFVDGRECPRQTLVEVGKDAQVLRAGSSLFLICDDITPFQVRGVERRDGVVMGPRLAAVWQIVRRHARSNSSLFIMGESGAGKERAVQAFHELGPRSEYPLVAVNCGAIPEGMAERLFFGTRRGAYSGATADAPGYVQAANGGLLFLDEIAELDLATQAKLLRVLETREVLPLGENRPRAVDIQVCAATHKHLRQEVLNGRFRQDLFYRIAHPEVHIPPLRERLEEIPWLIELAVQRALQSDTNPHSREPSTQGNARSSRLKIHISLAEVCLLRYWPGNVRELLNEVATAAHAAAVERNRQVRASHLSENAGRQFESDEQKPARDHTPKAGSRTRPDKSELEQALREHKGNISATARYVGVYRTQLRRWLHFYGIDAKDFTDD